MGIKNFQNNFRFSNRHMHNAKITMKPPILPDGINIKNLIRMVNHLKTIPSKHFSMVRYRDKHNEKEHECNSVGCAIGHCVQLDEPQNVPRSDYGSSNILFIAWSRQFTGLSCLSVEWEWCFSGCWAYSDNTPVGASMRILYMLENGVPEGWDISLAKDAESCFISMYRAWIGKMFKSEKDFVESIHHPTHL